MTKIYMVRHCETEGNATRRTQALVDSLVTRKGFEQVEALRKRFENIPIDAIYSSDSYRSIVTADPFAKERNLKIHCRISLREITTGNWEDEAWGNIADIWPEASRVWSATPWALTTPGANSFDMLADNLVYELKRIAKEMHYEGTALVVTHSCTIKAGLCRILGLPMTELKQFGHGDNTSVSLIDVDENGSMSVEFMNDASHLPDHLKRAWSGRAGSDINMSVYPYDPAKDQEALLRMAAARETEQGRPFDEAEFRKTVDRVSTLDPAYIGVSTLKGQVSGYVIMDKENDMPGDSRVIEQLYMIPELQGKGYGEQLFGYAAHELRYKDFETIVMHEDGTPEEKRMLDRFVFERMNGHPGYEAMPLFCPPYYYPILA